MVAFRRCLPESGSESELVGVSVAVECFAAVVGAVVELPVSQPPMRAAARPAGVADMQPVRRRGDICREEARSAFGFSVL